MPFLIKNEARGPISSSGTQPTILVGKDSGGERLTVIEAGIDPGAGLDLHVHPGYEEATLVIEGEIQAVLEGETRILGPGVFFLLLREPNIPSQINRTNRRKCWLYIRRLTLRGYSFNGVWNRTKFVTKRPRHRLGLFTT